MQGHEAEHGESVLSFVKMLEWPPWVFDPDQLLLFRITLGCDCQFSQGLLQAGGLDTAILFHRAKSVMHGSDQVSQNGLNHCIADKCRRSDNKYG